jgi:hypothetical protein
MAVDLSILIYEEAYTQTRRSGCKYEAEHNLMCLLVLHTHLASYRKTDTVVHVHHAVSMQMEQGYGSAYY